MEKDTPLISVVVPVYNTGHVLGRCLDSICTQTYSKLEIICVDDGSTDDSLSILRQFEERDARVKVISQSNQGMSAARNAALDVATGDWIAGVDSDDYIEPNTYETCLPAMLAGQAQVICYGTRIIGHDPLRESYLKLKYDGLEEVTCELLTRTPVCFWNKLYNRKWLEVAHVRFPVGLWFEDEAFFHLNAPRASFIYYYPQALYNYVVNAGGSIMDKAESGHSRILDRLRVLEFILEQFRLNPVKNEFSAIQLHIASAHYFSYLRMSRGRRESGWNSSWQMFRNLVDRFSLLALPAPPELEAARLRVAYFYYCPPGVACHIDDLYARMRKSEELLLQKATAAKLGELQESLATLRAESVRHHNTRKMLEEVKTRQTEIAASVAELRSDSVKHHNTRKMLESAQESLQAVRSVASGLSGFVAELRNDSIKHHNTRKMLEGVKERQTALSSAVSALQTESKTHQTTRQVLLSLQKLLTETREELSTAKSEFQRVQREAESKHRELLGSMQRDLEILVSRREIYLKYCWCCLMCLFTFGAKKRFYYQRKLELKRLYKNRK